MFFVLILCEYTSVIKVFGMDTLVQLTQRDIVKLQDFYERQVFAPQVKNLLHCILKWDETPTREVRELIRVYSPNGQWTPDGTFVAIFEFHCYEIHMFTADKYCKRLTYALQHTKQIDWQREALIYALHEDLHAQVIETLLKINVRICFIQENNFWIKNSSTVPAPMAKSIGNFYLGPLTIHHAKDINQIWPYKYEGSEEYVRTLIEMNGGVGVFEKMSTDDSFEDVLLAWVLQNGCGMLATLQTRAEHKRLGLAALAVQALSARMTAENITPICTIAEGNLASQKTFAKCGFQWFAKCYYIGTGTSTIRYSF